MQAFVLFVYFFANVFGKYETKYLDVTSKLQRKPLNVITSVQNNINRMISINKHAIFLVFGKNR
jgi:hypothetical protein